MLVDNLNNFREFCFNHYGLDCLHFQALPSLSWQACLKMTKIRLELVTDPTMYNFCEEMVASQQLTENMPRLIIPVLMITTQMTKNSNILYLDPKTLKGYVMSDPLPISSFQWLRPNEIKRF